MTIVINFINKQSLDCPRARLWKSCFFPHRLASQRSCDNSPRVALTSFCSCQVFPLVYALSSKPCLCSPRGQVFIVVDEMFLQCAWKQQSFACVVQSRHWCLFWNSWWWKEYFFLQIYCFYLLKSFCALCIESSRHFFVSLQCVGQRFVTSMVCITTFKPS